LVEDVEHRPTEETMYAHHLPPRHLWFAALVALALALAVVMAGEWLTQLDLNLFAGGAAAESTPAPPATWAEDPLTPPTVLLDR
jgi:hypothetical protein